MKCPHCLRTYSEIQLSQKDEIDIMAVESRENETLKKLHDMELENAKAIELLMSRLENSNEMIKNLEELNRKKERQAVLRRDRNKRYRAKKLLLKK